MTASTRDAAFTSPKEVRRGTPLNVATCSEDVSKSSCVSVNNRTKDVSKSSCVSVNNRTKDEREVGSRRPRAKYYLTYAWRKRYVC